MTQAFEYTAATVATTPARKVSVVFQGSSRQQIWYFDATSGSPTQGLLLADEDRSQTSGRALRRREYSWLQTADGNINQTAVLTTLDPGTPQATSTQQQIVKDSFGNTVQSREFDYGNSGQPWKIVTNTYVSDTAYTTRYLRTLLLAQQVTTGSGTVTVITNQYDETPLTRCDGITEHDGAADSAFRNRGNITTSTSLGAVTKACYDTTGMVTRLEDAAGTVLNTQMAPNSNNSIWGSILPNGRSELSITKLYDVALRPLVVMYPNNTTRRVTYDELGRKTAVVGQNGSIKTYAYSSSPAAVTITKGAKFRRISRDGFGRIVLLERGVNGLVTYTAERQYDMVHPQRLSRKSGWHAVSSPAVWETYLYDELGRRTAILLPGGSGQITFQYQGNAKIRTDPKGRTKTLLYDSSSNLRELIQPNPSRKGEVIRTVYAYDGLDRETSTAMASTNTTQNRSRTYGITGNVVARVNAEDGLTRYSQNSDGSVASKMDSRSQRTVYQYDSLKRLTALFRYTASGDLDPSGTILYHYDNNPFDPSYSTSVLGRLAAVEWGTRSVPGGRFIQMYAYTASGLLAGKRLLLNRLSGTLTADVGYTYDSNGRISSITYPGQLGTFTYSYDAFGRPIMLIGPQGPSSPLVKDVTYTPYNAVGAMSLLVPGTTDYYRTTRSYSARRAVTRITGGPAVPGPETQWMPAIDLQYTYSVAADDMKAIMVTEAVGGEVIRYSYDSLGRLQAAETVGDGWGMSFDYDDFGNLLRQRVTKGKAYDVAAAYDPATNRPIDPTAQVDGAGNLTATSVAQLQYDTANRIVQATGGAQSFLEQYEYDPDNLRVWVMRNGIEEITLYGVDRQVIATFHIGTDGTGKDSLIPTGTMVYFCGGLIQSAGAAVVRDRANSVRVRVGATNGRESKVLAYYPYGQERVAQNPNAAALSAARLPTEGFGSYLRSPNTLIDYAKQRYYSSVLGRFLTVDPSEAPGKPERPETWNRYAFVAGDPVNCFDPDGLSSYGSCAASSYSTSTYTSQSVCQTFPIPGPTTTTTTTTWNPNTNTLSAHQHKHVTINNILEWIRLRIKHTHLIPNPNNVCTPTAILGVRG